LSEVSVVASSPASRPSWLDRVPTGALDAAVEQLADVARRGGTVVVAAHVQPDGDALGSALALHLGLGPLGARTVPTVGDRPLRIPAGLTALPAIDELVASDRLPAAADVDLLVTVDAASPDRLGTVERYLEAGVPTIVVDHHASTVPFGDLRVVAPSAPATVQLVAELLDRLGVALTEDIATCLYVGLVTDTGRFGYASADRSALELAARLFDAGVDHASVHRRLFETRSLGELRLTGHALERMAFVPDVALVHTHVTQEELAAAGAGSEALDGLIDVVRTADVAEVTAVCKPDAGRWRVSLRSRGTVDVGAIAATLGGGGHAAAAGYTTSGGIDGVVAELLAALREG
jgi:bifunctional oligoribonuclease and PAP phosphatase NrnA